MIVLLKNCRLSNNQNVHILIKNGIINKITPITNPEQEFTYEEKIDQTFDIKNNLVMPGIVDAFSKVTNPSAYVKSDYLTESIACAYGGITTFVDSSIKLDQTDNYTSAISEKISEAVNSSYVNFAFAPVVSEISNLKELVKISNLVVGNLLNFKARVANERIESIEKMNAIIDNSKLVYLHLSGFDIDLFFSNCTNRYTKLVFYDVTNDNDLQRLLTYKKAGFNIIIATSITYLLLNQDMLNSEYKRKTITPEYKLGSLLNNIQLWNAVKNQEIDILTSSHAAITLLEKFETNNRGLPNFETLFSLLFDNCMYKRIPISILEELLCKNPAQICGLRNKGQIKEGFDADLIVVNTTRRWWIKDKDIVSKARWTPFNDYRISGRIIMTFVNGELLYSFANQMNPIRKVRISRPTEIKHINY